MLSIIAIFLVVDTLLYCLLQEISKNEKIPNVIFYTMLILEIITTSVLTK